MKILFISHKFYPDIGGIEVNSQILATEFFDNGNEVRVLTWTKHNGVDSFPFKVIRNPNILEVVLQHIWAEVVFENNPSLRLSWVRLFIPKPSVIAIRTWVSRINGKVGVVDKFKLWWISRASAVIAISEAIKKRSSKEATVIGNPYRSEIFKNINYNYRPLDFVFLGRLVSDKGADLAIKAMNLMLNKYFKKEEFPVKLSIIGDGPEGENLKKLTKYLGVENNVTFFGALRDTKLVEVLNLHKYILIPSVWEEPFGNVALEGLACGCIPIASNGGGLIDAVGDSGLIFESGNVNSLVECMFELYNNSNIRERLILNSNEHLKNHLAPVVGKKYLKILESVYQNKA